MLGECTAGADGTDEIETSLAHTSNLEALMRRRIALVCPELDAGFRRADHDNSGALDRSELVQLLVDAGVEMDESRMDGTSARGFPRRTVFTLLARRGQR